MRHIYLDDGLRLRFSGRDEEFDQGVEIGIVAALMSSGQGDFTRWLSTANVEQARALGVRMGYRLILGHADDEWTEMTFTTARARAKLTLVHSRGDAERNAVA